MTTQSTISALLDSPLRVRVQMTDDDSDAGHETTLGEYAAEVFDVFGGAPDSETLGELIAIAGVPWAAQTECGPDTVTMLSDVATESEALYTSDEDDHAVTFTLSEFAANNEGDLDNIGALALLGVGDETELSGFVGCAMTVRRVA